MRGGKEGLVFGSLVIGNVPKLDVFSKIEECPEQFTHFASRALVTIRVEAGTFTFTKASVYAR